MSILTDLIGEHSRLINKCLCKALRMKSDRHLSRMRISKSQAQCMVLLVYAHIELRSVT